MKKLILKLTLMGVLVLLAAVPALAVDYVTHSVQPGETLEKIAVLYCSTWQEIYDANQAAVGLNPNVVFVGTVLTVPNRCAVGLPSTNEIVYDRGAKTHATGSVTNGSYTVARGDTLFSIGQRFGIALTNLRAANGFTADRTRIYTGTQLVIPGLGSTATVLPATPSAPTTLPSTPAAPTNRVFNASECTVQVNVTATFMDAPGGSNVLATLTAGTYPALQVSQVGNATWYQLEYVDTTGWIINVNEAGMQELTFIGSCGLSK